MKKRMALMLVLTMLVSPAACGGTAFCEESAAVSPVYSQGRDEGNTAREITRKEYPVHIMEMELDEPLPLYFLKDGPDLPYVELGDWTGILNFICTDGGTDPGYLLRLETEGSSAAFIRETGYSMIMDFDRDTFEFWDYNGFMKVPAMATLLDFAARRCVNDEGEPSLMKKTGEVSYDRYGDGKIVSLGDYGIDLICQDGLYLAPLQTMSDFTLAPGASAMNCFFNGRCVLFSSLGTEPFAALYYDAPTGRRSEALTRYGYSELCLMLDSFYGLKDIHGIGSFRQFIREAGLEEAFLSPDAETADRALCTLIRHYIDDLHSSFDAFSCLAGPLKVSADRGPSYASLAEHRRLHGEARERQYPEGVPQYEEIGNTAYITFDHFEVLAESYEAYYGHENIQDIPFEDTIAMIIRAHEQITRQDSPIENVVIDLSCNVGGSVDSAAFLLAWCLGKSSISLRDSFTGAVSTTDYWADVNLDRVFDERDSIADRNLFCLISPVSFSCGNLVPNVFRQSGRVTLLGRTSGGGSCVVMPASTAWGTAFSISSPRRMSFLKNGSLYDIDRGADPDYAISRPEKYYDRQALTAYIGSLY